MSDPALGGASSATPDSQSSPLQTLKAPRPERKTTAHFPPIDSGFRSVIIYLTICVQRKRSLLVDDPAARLIVAAWRANTFWCVGRYVIMPDHVHLFCAPNSFPARPLKKWIECWKNHVTREWTNRSQIPIWQREFWDRQLRHAESYEEKWNYVRNNPVRHGYVFGSKTGPTKGNSMSLSGTTGSLEGGALRRRIRQPGLDRARRARPSSVRDELSSSANSATLSAPNAANNPDRR
jgi:REP element-mobilizing transposase RayT